MMNKTREASEDCPICLDTVRMGLMTPCGHSFCGDCILEVWRMSRTCNPISCPYCRQEVTSMKPYLSVEERNTVEPGEVELRSRMLERLWRYRASVKYVGSLTKFMLWCAIMMISVILWIKLDFSKILFQDLTEIPILLQNLKVFETDLIQLIIQTSLYHFLTTFSKVCCLLSLSGSAFILYVILFE